jgi:hypothetical protein
MNEYFSLSHAERELLVELLQKERDDLPVEIRHTRVASYRDRLRHRRALVQELLDRMQVGVET